MKSRRTISSSRRQSGVSLIECLVYVALFGLLLGGGTTVFYFSWDHTRAIISASDEVESALRAGEAWRADIRAATGKISVQSTSSGQIVEIPQANQTIIYRLTNGELRREIPAEQRSRIIFAALKSCEMKSSLRSEVTAWCWDMELAARHKGLHLPLLFTFEAAQPKP